MSLPIKPVVDVTYTLSPISAVRMGFNLGLIIGSSKVLSQNQGLYVTSVDEMIEAGFSVGSPEVLAAQIYFSATSKPKHLYVVRQVLETVPATKSYTGPIANGNTVTIGETVYTIGDGTEETTTVESLLTELQEVGATATYEEEVLHIEQSAQMLDLITPAITVAQGSGPAITGVVAAIEGETEETKVEALTKARNLDQEWYTACFVDKVTNEEALAIAPLVESMSHPTTWFFITSDPAVVAGQEDNIFAQLNSKGFSRTLGIASEEEFTHVGIMGYAMGQTKDTVNSSYTLGLKEIVGVDPDNYTSMQVRAVEAQYGNVYVNRGTYYNVFEEGRVFSGAWFDEIIQLDKLANRVQLNVMDLLVKNPKLPQTEGGVSRIITTIISANEEAVKTGFIAPGKWTNGDVLGLKEGDYLPLGYAVLAESIDDQPVADREARKAPNIYDCIKLAGAIQSVTIEINVNR